MKFTREPVYMHPDTLTDLRALLPPDLTAFARDPEDDAVRLREMRQAFVSGIEIRTTELLKRGECIQLPPLKFEMPEPVFKFAEYQPFLSRRFVYGIPKMNFGLLSFGCIGEDSWEREARRSRERRARKLAMKRARRTRIKADNARRAKRR